MPTDKKIEIPSIFSLQHSERMLVKLEYVVEHLPSQKYEMVLGLIFNFGGIKRTQKDFIETLKNENLISESDDGILSVNGLAEYIGKLKKAIEIFKKKRKVREYET